jgi:hypothetical protein
MPSDAAGPVDEIVTPIFICAMAGAATMAAATANDRTPAFRRGDAGEVMRMVMVSSGLPGLSRWAELLFA